MSTAFRSASSVFIVYGVFKQYVMVLWLRSVLLVQVRDAFGLGHQLFPRAVQLPASTSTSS